LSAAAPLRPMAGRDNRMDGRANPLPLPRPAKEKAARGTPAASGQTGCRSGRYGV